MENHDDKLFNKYLLYKKKYLQKKLNMTGGSPKNEIMLFKANWCGHCKSFLPIWQKIEKDPSLNVNFTTFDSVENKREMQLYNIEGFPTIIYKVNDKLIEYTGSRDEKSVREFIKSYN